MASFKKLKERIAAMPPGAKKDVLENLAAEAAFMKIQLAALRKKIKKDGWEEQYQNGANQKGIKKSVAGDTYNQLFKNYSICLQKISDLLPPDEVKDEFDEFLRKKRERGGDQSEGKV